MEILNWNELVDLYVDGELSDEEARRVEERSRFDMALRSQIDWTRRMRRLFEDSKRPFPKDYESRLQAALRNSEAWNAIDARRTKAVGSSSKPNRRTRARNSALVAASVAAVLVGVALFSDATWRRDVADFSDRLLALNSVKEPSSEKLSEPIESFRVDAAIVDSAIEQDTESIETAEPLQTVNPGTLMASKEGDSTEESCSANTIDLQSSNDDVLGVGAPTFFQMDGAVGLSSSPSLGEPRVSSLNGFSARSAGVSGRSVGNGKFREGVAFSSAPQRMETRLNDDVAFKPRAAEEGGTSEFTLRRDARRLSQKEYWVKVSFAGSAELRAQTSEIERICEEEGICYLQNGGKGEARLVNVAPTQLRRLAERLGEGAARDVKVSRALQEWAQTPSDAPAKENLKDVLLVFHLQSEASDGSAEELDANASTAEETAPIENAPSVEGEAL